jgi:hypothetical protein
MLSVLFGESLECWVMPAGGSRGIFGVLPTNLESLSTYAYDFICHIS